MIGKEDMLSRGHKEGYEFTHGIIIDLTGCVYDLRDYLKPRLQWRTGKIEFVIDWCIKESLLKTLLLPTEDHYKSAECQFFYDQYFKDEIAKHLMQFVGLNILERLNNPILSLVYTRRNTSIYLISPGI